MMGFPLDVSNCWFADEPIPGATIDLCTTVMCKDDTPFAGYSNTKYYVKETTNLTEDKLNDWIDWDDIPSVPVDCG